MEKVKRYQRPIRQKTFWIFAYTGSLNKVKLCKKVLLRKVAKEIRWK